MNMTRIGPIAAMVALSAGLTTATATAQEAEAPAKPPVVQHDLEGRNACLACHAGAMEAIPGVPDTHTNRTDETCLWCHAADATMQTDEAKAVTHELEGRSACSMCHAAGAMEAIPDVPASHEGRADQFCTLCHQPGG
jgi:hypothetical protein